MAVTSQTTQRRSGFHLRTEGFGSAHYAAMALAVVSGVVHLYPYATQEYVPFLLAGLGFFGAIGLLLLTVRYRPWVYLAGIPYTVAQMVGWYVAGMPEFTLGVFDKTVQLALIVLLAYLLVRSRGEPKSRSDRE